jgi:hypothetical protein
VQSVSWWSLVPFRSLDLTLSPIVDFDRKLCPRNICGPIVEPKCRFPPSVHLGPLSTVSDPPWKLATLAQAPFEGLGRLPTPPDTTRPLEEEMQPATTFSPHDPLPQRPCSSSLPPGASEMGHGKYNIEYHEGEWYMEDLELVSEEEKPYLSR